MAWCIGCRRRWRPGSRISSWSSTRRSGCSRRWHNRIAPEVIYFIRARDDLLHAFDPSSQEKAFPCPRTWAFVSKLLDVAPKDKGGKLVVDNVHRTLIKGTVGEGAMVEFAGFLELYKDLPSPEVVVADPNGASDSGQSVGSHHAVRVALPACG